MKTVIMAQTNQGFQEFFLPGIHNSDYQIRLDREIFGLAQDIVLKLEILDGTWRIVKDESYSVVSEGGREELALQDESVFYLYPSGAGPQISLLSVLWKRSRISCRKYDISRLSEVSVGSVEENMLCYQFHTYISQRHALFVRTQNGWCLYDYGKNGTFVNGVRVNNSRLLQFGDCITMFGLRLIFLGDTLALSAVGGELKADTRRIPALVLPALRTDMPKVKKREKKKYYKSAPRTVEPLFDGEIEIENPPAKKNTKRKPLFLTIGSAFTMAIPMLLGCSISVIAAKSRGSASSAYMYTGMITAVSSAVFGVIWALNNLKYAKKEEEEEEELRYNAYGQYLIDMANLVREKYENNMRILHSTYLSGEACCRVTTQSGNLWNRNISQKDFLRLRLGCGDLPFPGIIRAPKQKFTLLKDDLMEKPAQLQKNFETMYQVPVCLDLMEHRLVGVIGGAGREGGCRILENMIAQAAANNSYTDVKMVFIYDGDKGRQKERWEFVKWLPHVWSENKKIRYVAENKSDLGDLCFALGSVLRDREEENPLSDGRSSFKRPHYIVFLIDPEMLEGELIYRYVAQPSEKYGISTFWLAERYEELPNSCEEIICSDGHISGIYNVKEGMSQFKQISFDQVAHGSLEAFARSMAGVEVEDAQKGGSIPNELDFLSMYQADSLDQLQVAQRWKKNRVYESMRVPIGKRSGEQDCFLDIHEKYHGPHGLVAGTTGSGKSETLQTYILSLAVNFSPDDVCFFIIDFKGGGMANLFTDLPHLAGQISNLSGNQVRRAMVSIKSENRRRQRIFNDNSVNNINSYSRLYKNGEASVPVPHLLIVIDEFAELKREEPEFMKELISVAQVGRSLGVHLILATQKPDGTVDENIWSNTKFRLCLRVQDRKDSNGMLHRPDAAYITQAGRCYLQVGNDEIFELFQSGYSGAVYDTALESSKTVAQMISVTGKKVLAGSRMRREHKEKLRREWYIALAEILNERAMSCSVPIKRLFEEIGGDEEKLRPVFEKIWEAGYSYEFNAQNVQRLKTFNEVWPDRETDWEKAAAVLMKLSDRGMFKLPEVQEKTQLEAVIEHVARVAEENHYEKPRKLWMPVLPLALYLEELEGFKRQGKDCAAGTAFELKAPIGLYDDPVNQDQGTVWLNFAENGHHAVCGSVVSGKSTFLQTAVFSFMNSYTPAQLQFYLLDFGSRMLSCLEKAPHVGGVVYDGDADRARMFFSMLERMMNERRELFKGGSYSQYVRANGPVLPAVMVVIDNYAGFKEKTQEKYADTVLRLSREGVGYGIYLLVSAAGFGMAEIPGRIADNIKTAVALEMGDKFKYAEVLRQTRVETMPESGIKGRGLIWANGELLEFQTALALKAEDDFARSRKLEEVCGGMALQWKGDRAVPIPEIPKNPELGSFLQLPEVQSCCKNQRCIPIGYREEDAGIYAIDLAHTYFWVISGKSGSGKTNLMKGMIQTAAQKEAELVVIEQQKQELAGVAGKYRAKYVASHQEIFDFFKELRPEFIRRNQMKRKFLAEGIEGEALYERMRGAKPVYIFVADMAAFIADIYKKLPDGSTMSGFVENIAEKGQMHNIYFFGCVKPEEETALFGQKTFKLLAEHASGIHLGGNAAAQRIFTFSNIPFAQQSRVTKPGSGLVPSAEDSSCAETVILPIARGN